MQAVHRLIFRLSVSSILIAGCLSAYGQIEVSSLPTLPYSPDYLINNVLLGEGVAVDNVIYSASNDAGVGLFSGGMSTIGIDEGIVLSTGTVADIDSPYDNQDPGVAFENGVHLDDSELSSISLGPFGDVISYEFSFVPTSDVVSFNYVFASQEYPDFVCANVNDVFGFFITGENPEGGQYAAENIALVPDPNDPSNQTFTTLPVSINSVNSGQPGSFDLPDGTQQPHECEGDLESLAYSTFYNDNQSGTSFKFGGYSDVFSAVTNVVACERYTLKIVIADVNDWIRDSAVFLESKSFSSSTLKIERISSQEDIAEGCLSAEYRFILPSPVANDSLIPYRIISTDLPGSTADATSDYNIREGSLMFAAGTTVARLTIDAIADDMLEEIEYIGIEIPTSSCGLDTIVIGIRDNMLEDSILKDSIGVCDGLPVELQLKESISSTSAYRQDTTVEVNLIDNGETRVPLEVQGYGSREMTDRTIFRICIDSLIHTDLTDIDMYVESPSGQVLELSTDNGIVSTGNPDDQSNYISTCFDVGLTADNINNGNEIAGTVYAGNLNYRGDFTPEGDPSVLWSDRGSVNGTWELIINDDQMGQTGRLTGWRIDFEPTYIVLSTQWFDENGTFVFSSREPQVDPAIRTTYFLDITDSFGCSSTDSIVVIPSAALDISQFGINVTAPSSSCTDDGSINVTGPADKEYVYEIQNQTNSTGQFDNLSNGRDTLFISDELCSNFAVLDIGNSSPLDVEFSLLRPQCSNEATGSITATLRGGVGNVSYSWDSGDTGANLNNIPAGQYIVTATDSGNCTHIDSIIITNVTDLQPNLTRTIDTLCFAGSGAVAASLAADGTFTRPADFDYQWNDPLMSTNFSTGSLSAGVYTVTVTNPNTGCSIIDSIEIYEREPIIRDTIINELDCFNSTNGSISLELNGGTAMDFEVVWDTGDATPSIEGLTADMYEVTVTDLRTQCVQEEMFSLIAPDTIKSNIELDSVSCFGLEDGAIMVTAGGGIGGLEFIWTDNVTGPDRSGLAAGPYELTIQDNNNCRLVETYEVPGPLQISNNVDQKTDVQCHGESTGSLDMSFAGGVGSYTHSWTQVDGPFTSSAEDVFGLSAGNYAIETIDSLGCSEKDTFEIFENPEILIMEDITDVSCTGDGNGRINIASEGGAGALEFLWTGPGTFSSTDESISDLDGGSYQLIVTDLLGCQTSSTPFLVDEPLSAVDIVQVNTDTICNGASDGILSASAIGGTGILTYTWDGTIIGERITNLSAGLYSLEVMDEKGCTDREEIAVVEKDLLNVEFDLKPTDCFEESVGTGSASIRTIDGTVGAIGNYTYLWNDANPPSVGISAENLVGEATYSVSITDDDGCVDIQEVFIPSPDPILIEEVAIIQTSCNAGDDASIQVTASGGSGAPYIYTWSGNTRFQTTDKAEDLQQGFYSVTVSDQNGCESEADFAITDPAELVVVTTGFDVSCFGDNDGVGQVTAIGGTPGYSIQWSNGVTSDMNQELVAGKYLVEVMDDNGCIAVDSILINEPEEAIRIETTPNGSQCGTDQAGSIDVVASGGNGNYRYSLDNLVYSGSPNFLGLEPGTYDVYVKDEKGCIEQSSNITVPEPVSGLTVDIGEDEKINFGSSITVVADIPGGNPPFIYSWRVDPEVPLSCLDCEEVTLDDLEVPVVLTLTVADATGCSLTSSKRITLENFNFIDVPTGFTPDGNGSNDLLSVYGKKEVVIENFRVYSRWGQVVYEQRNFPVNDETIGWDGRFKGQAMNADVYVWTIEAAFPNGEKAIYQGQTQLIR